MNTYQNNYLMAKTLRLAAFDAFTDEGTDAEWDEYEARQALEAEAADQLIAWARKVALAMAGPADRVLLERLFAKAADRRNYDARRKVLEMTLRLDAR